MITSDSVIKTQNDVIMVYRLTDNKVYFTFAKTGKRGKVSQSDLKRLIADNIWQILAK